MQLMLDKLVNRTTGLTLATESNKKHENFTPTARGIAQRLDID